MKRPVCYMMALLALTSCEHQQTLHFPEQPGWDDTRRRVRVTFDWSECPEANPAEMDLYLIPTDGNAHYRHLAFSGRDGGWIYVAEGEYAAVALNPDCENVRITNPESTETFRLALRPANGNVPQASTTSTGDPAGGYATSPSAVFFTPDYIWTSWINNLSITADLEEIVIPMSETFCRYSVEVLNLEGSSKVSSIQGVLYGNHPVLGFDGAVDGEDDSGLLFSLGKNEKNYPRPNPGNIQSSADLGALWTIPLTATTTDTTSSTEARFYGEFLTLGHCGLTRQRGRNGATERSHALALQFIMTDGSYQTARVDVTDQVHSQPLHRCHIRLDTLKLPNTGGDDGGGFRFTVDDWEEINLNVSAN